MDKYALLVVNEALVRRKKMGEARRRKQLLGDNYGRGLDICVDVHLETFKHSSVEATISIPEEDVAQKIVFHLFVKNKKMYAEALTRKEDKRINELMSQTIDQVSPLVCNQFLKMIGSSTVFVN